MTFRHNPAYQTSRGQLWRKNSHPHQGRQTLNRGAKNYCCAHLHNPTPGANITHRHQKENPAKRANINIATLNMRGSTVRNTTLIQKWGDVSKTIYKNKIAILALQETHLDQAKMTQVHECFSKNLEIVTSEDPDDPTGKAGVAFIINKTILDLREIMTHELHQG
jgi:hypothetical protein